MRMSLDKNGMKKDKDARMGMRKDEDKSEWDALTCSMFDDLPRTS